MPFLQNYGIAVKKKRLLKRKTGKKSLKYTHYYGKLVADCLNLQNKRRKYVRNTIDLEWR